MTSKVKAASSEKNIDISINIENNLFSKNKCDGLDKSKKKNDNIPRIQTKLGEIPPTDLLDAYGAEAESKLYGAIAPNRYSAGTFTNRFAQYRGQQLGKGENRWLPQQTEDVDASEDEDSSETSGFQTPIQPEYVEYEDDEEDTEAGAALGPPTPQQPIYPTNLNASNKVFLQEKYVGIKNAKEARKSREAFANANQIPWALISTDRHWRKAYNEYLQNFV